MKALLCGLILAGFGYAILRFDIGFDLPSLTNVESLLVYALFYIGLISGINKKKIADIAKAHDYFVTWVHDRISHFPKQSD